MPEKEADNFDSEGFVAGLDFIKNQAMTKAYESIHKPTENIFLSTWNMPRIKKSGPQ
ncbi:MAG: hypothetical protein QXP53_02195 [Candidatus Pacearchaeota archaeon]